MATLYIDQFKVQLIDILLENDGIIDGVDMIVRMLKPNVREFIKQIKYEELRDLVKIPPLYIVIKPALYVANAIDVSYGRCIEFECGPRYPEFTIGMEHLKVVSPPPQVSNQYGYASNGFYSTSTNNWTWTITNNRF